MTHIEDLLRDAYRGAAETIEPESVRDLDVRPAPLLRQLRHQQSRRNRVMIPMAAAASVAMVVVLATVIVPRAMNWTDAFGQSPGTVTSGRYPAYFVSITAGPGQLSVNRASTGAFVTEIRMPGRGMLVNSVAGWGNQDFVAAILRPGVCATWLYEFRLNDQGHPSAPAPLAVIRGRQLENISVSGNGEKLAFYAIECGGSHGSAGRNDLVVMDKTTERTRQWAIPVQASASLSLSASGHLLAYSFGPTLNSAPSVMVMPTNAAPGPAVTRSRTVVRAAQFGRSTEIGSAVLTPDGRTVYVVTSSTGTVRAWNPVWQLRAVDLASRRSRLVASFAGFPSAIAADPAVRHVLVMFEPASAGPSPSPSPSPSGKPTPSPLPSPTGKPTPSPLPSPTGKPTPSPSPSRTGKPTPSPVPTGQPTPSPSPSSGNQPQQLLVRIDLSTGHVTYLRAVPVAVLSYFW